MFGTGRNDNILGRVIQSVIAFQFGADRGAQVGETRYRGIVTPIVANSLYRCLFDVGGRIEIRFAQTHIDHIHAFGTKLPPQLSHFERLGFVEASEEGGEVHSFIS